MGNMSKFEQNVVPGFSNIFKVSEIYQKYLKYLDFDEKYLKYFRIQMGNMFEFEQNVEREFSNILKFTQCPICTIFRHALFKLQFSTKQCSTSKKDK